MLLSIDNFKSIAHIVDVNLSDLTVLAGANSSGKSSLIQGLLLLKQTLGATSNEMLNLAGPYVYADSLMDLMHDKKAGEMRLEIKFEECELQQTPLQSEACGDAHVESLHVAVGFQIKTNKAYQLSEFRLKVGFSDGSERSMSLTKRPQRRIYDMRMDEEIYREVTVDNYSFANFFPVFVKHKDKAFDLPLVKAVRETVAAILGDVNYIAPLRVAPVLARTFQRDVETRYVEPDGENTRYILDLLAEQNRTAFNMVRHWICSRLGLAKDLRIVKESGKRYRVVVTTQEDVEVDLVHMGFGLSQILPIVTQGCISAPGSLLIVEDPDVHMHPGIQAAMADFFIFLYSSRGVNALIETHSDHFITRLRRRIAEKSISAEFVHLIFVEKECGESEYITIPLSASGRMEGSMPEGFMDSLDNDFRAIIEAGLK